MVYRVLCIEKDDKLFQPPKFAEVYTTRERAREAALNWVNLASGRHAVIVGQIEGLWSTVAVQSTPPEEKAKPKRERRKFVN